jgi:uncharacterized protein YbjT (DUF2867 family)
MRVLLTGASGFVGGEILLRLLSEGHRVVAISRDRSRLPTTEGLEIREFEFANALQVEDWTSLLEGVHAVVNSVGIIRETRRSRFEDLHARAPLALFRAAKRAGVRRIVQISAHGVKRGSRFEYQTSKAQADDFLLEECADRACILRPSLIFGEAGDATRMFRKLAALPVIPLVGTGEYRFRPIQVEDVACLAEIALTRDPMPTGAFDVGGDEVMSLRQLLLALRASNDGVRDLNDAAWEDGPTVKVPLAMMRVLARTGDFAKVGPMDSDMLGMLIESADFEVEGLEDSFGFRPRGLRSALVELKR